MGGIAAILTCKKDNEETIKRMMARMKHRDKNGQGFYFDENISLGQCGIPTTCYSSENLVIALDGYILNNDELEHELNVQGLNDQELILEGFKTWGADVPKHLRGSFSFIIWDKESKVMYGAKDHWSTKPLYYYHNEDTIVLASEIKAILEYPGFQKELNRDCIAPYLVFGFNPLDETFFKNVFTFNPGNCFIYRENKLKITEYFRPVFEESDIGLQQAVELIEGAVKDSVEKSISGIAPETLGSFLSSGVDSSYLAGLARPKKTFTVGYKEQKYDEIEIAKKTAAQMGVGNTEKYVTREEYLEAVPEVMYHFDEPISDPATIALYLGAEAASREVDTIICGEAADEFFAGYSIYKDSFKFRAYSVLPFFIRKVIAKIFLALPKVKGSSFLIRRGMVVEDWYRGLNWVFREREIGRYLRCGHSIPIKSITDKVFASFSGQSDLNKMQGFDIYFSLAKNFLANCDKMLSAFSLKVRLPFADTRVFDVARILPFSAKVSKSTTKVALRDAARETLPDELYKIKKLGFPVPLRVWMKEKEYYSEIEDMFNTDIAKEIFEHDKLIKLLNEHVYSRKDNYKKIWAIYAFLVWYHVYFK